MLGVSAKASPCALRGDPSGAGAGCRGVVTQPCVSPRAPVLVALALIESGMKYEDAIQFIRQ